MDDSTAPLGVGIARRTGPASRRILVAALAIAMTAAIVAILPAVPAQGETSPRYQRLWDELSNKNHRWARRVSECESGGDRNIHGAGGDYHGAFQFMLSTWRRAPKSPGGDPHRKSWKTQAVVAIYLKKKDGARTYWPGCA